MTAPTEPTGVQYRRLTGWMMNVSGDPVMGTVYKFEAVLNRVYDTSATPPAIINTDPVYGRFGADHIMRDQAGDEGVWIVDPNDPTLSPTGFNYRVTVEAPGCKTESFNIDIPSGSGDVDLATVMPVDPRLGTPNVKGDKGDKGEPSTVPGPPGAGDFEIDAYYLAQITAVAGAPAAVRFTDGTTAAVPGFTQYGGRTIYAVVDVDTAHLINTTMASLGTAGTVTIRAVGGGTSLRGYAFPNGAGSTGAIAAGTLTDGRFTVAASTDDGLTSVTAQQLGGTVATAVVPDKANGYIVDQDFTMASSAGFNTQLIAAFVGEHTDPQRNQLLPLMLAWADARDSHFVPPLSWDEITGKPAVIGAGATQAAARTAIGAGTSNLALGTTAGTALEGDTTAGDIGGATDTGGGREKVAALSATTGTATGDLDAASVFTVTPTGNITLAFSNIPTTGTACTLTVIISMGSLKTVTMPSGTVWLSGAPTLVASKTAVFTMLTVDGGTTWIASAGVEA